MKKVLLSLLILVLYSNLCYGEIYTQNNSFDKSIIVYSKSNSQPKQLPRFYIFKKYTTDNLTRFSVTLHNQNIVTNIFNNTEDAKIKLDDNEILTLNTRVSVDARLERQCTMSFEQDVAEKILNCSKLEFQIPVYFRREHEETSYFYAVVPQDVLNEWKNVIRCN